MNENVQRYPLQWPVGWKRSTARMRARFGKVCYAAAVMDRGRKRPLSVADAGCGALPPKADAWTVLGLTRSASQADVLAAHRRLAVEHHPDRGGDVDHMARINGARDEILRVLHASV